jgi:hypothetical protein
MCSRKDTVDVMTHPPAIMRRDKSRPVDLTPAGGAKMKTFSSGTANATKTVVVVFASLLIGQSRRRRS